jgi:hypothetical protein
MSKIPNHVEHKLQSFFELLVPSAIGLKSLLYGGQASSSKITIQQVKVKKGTKANKVVFHLVEVKENIACFKIDPTFDEAIFSYINEVYIEKVNKYIYYHWVVKSMKSFLVQRRKGNHKQWVVAKLHSQIFIPITYIETIDENGV